MYTKGMSVGAGAGLGFFGLFSIFSVLTSGELTGSSLVIRLILLAAFFWAWRSFKGFREELADTNRSGKILAWITVFISAVAAFLSAALLSL
jgi:hypothetical protein